MVMSKYSLFQESWRMSLMHIVWHLCEYICTVNYSSETLRWIACVINFHSYCQIALQKRFRGMWTDVKQYGKAHTQSTRYCKTKDFCQSDRWKMMSCFYLPTLNYKGGWAYFLFLCFLFVCMCFNELLIHIVHFSIVKFMFSFVSLIV